MHINCSLTKLDVRYSGIEGEGAEQLAAAVLESKSMEEFSLIPMKGLRADEVTELNLHSKGLGPAEVRVISSLLTANSSLTSLDVGWNEIGKEAAPRPYARTHMRPCVVCLSCLVGRGMVHLRL